MVFKIIFLLSFMLMKIKCSPVIIYQTLFTRRTLKGTHLFLLLLPSITVYLHSINYMVGRNQEKKVTGRPEPGRS